MQLALKTIPGVVATLSLAFYLGGCGSDEGARAARTASISEESSGVLKAGQASTTALEHPSEGNETISGEEESPVFFASLRTNLEGEDASVVGAVLDVQGEVLEVSVVEVLSAGLQAKQNPTMCPRLEAGYRFEVTNTTAKFNNDLKVGEKALFVGQMCDEFRAGEMWIVPNSPNARRLGEGGIIDLGGGDVITLDEARKLAGRSFAPVPVATDQLVVNASLDGARLRVDLSGETSARIGIVLCDPGLVSLTSPVQDYFGRCSLQSVDSTGMLLPSHLERGELTVIVQLPTERQRPFDVVVFGEDASGLFQVRGISQVR